MNKASNKASRFLLICLLTGCLTVGNIPGILATDSSLVGKNFWVKAGKQATSVFGQITNETDKKVRLTTATAPGYAARVELHDTRQALMHNQLGGFLLAAHSTLNLTPGGKHLMLIGLEHVLKPGEAIKLKLNFSNGTQIVVTALVKDFAGAEEKF